MTTHKKWTSRKERKELRRRLRSENPGLEVMHPEAAGIDVGNSAHYVAVRPDRDPEPVRRFDRDVKKKLHPQPEARFFLEIQPSSL